MHMRVHKTGRDNPACGIDSFGCVRVLRCDGCSIIDSNNEPIVDGDPTIAKHAPSIIDSNYEATGNDQVDRFWTVVHLEPFKDSDFLSELTDRRTHRQVARRATRLPGVSLRPE